MLPSAAGLVVVGPLLGFASWHAYRASVCVTQATQATQAPQVNAL